jgi:hypothetical protein
VKIWPRRTPKVAGAVAPAKKSIISSDDEKLVDAFSMLTLQWELRFKQIVILLGADPNDGERLTHPLRILMAKRRTPTDNERNHMQALLIADHRLLSYFEQKKRDPKQKDLFKGMSPRKWFEEYELPDGQTPWCLIILGGEKNLSLLERTVLGYVNS